MLLPQILEERAQMRDDWNKSWVGELITGIRMEIYEIIKHQTHIGVNIEQIPVLSIVYAFADLV